MGVFRVAGLWTGWRISIGKKMAVFQVFVVKDNGSQRNVGHTL